MLTSLIKGGGGVSQLLTITDKGKAGVQTPHWVYKPRQSDVSWSICRPQSYRASGFLFATVPHRA